MPDARGRLSLREAAEKFDVSRPTLAKALAAGKLTAERDASGAWRVEAVEVARLYHPRRGVETVEDAEPVRSGPDPDAVAELAALRAELALERARREAAETLAAERAAHLADLRRLLTGPDAPTRRRWWPW